MIFAESLIFELFCDLKCVVFYLFNIYYVGYVCVWCIQELLANQIFDLYCFPKIIKFYSTSYNYTDNSMILEKLC